jgi:hypothetical protein
MKIEMLSAQNARTKYKATFTYPTVFEREPINEFRTQNNYE